LNINEERNKQITAAIDVVDSSKITYLLDALRDKLSIIKIGSQVFTYYGIEIINKVKNKGYKIFLDLKFHDIPNTVEKAVLSAQHHDIHMLTIHISGGKEMIERAVSVTKNAGKPLILGVTVLTSMNDTIVNELQIKDNIENLVPQYAIYGKKAGLHGVICSPHEINKVRALCGDTFLIITPGIRFDKSADDQKRVMTPRDAIKNGADYIVIGRPILESNNLDSFFYNIWR